MSSVRLLTSSSSTLLRFTKAQELISVGCLILSSQNTRKLKKDTALVLVAIRITTYSAIILYIIRQNTLFRIRFIIKINKTEAFISFIINDTYCIHNRK